MFFLFGSLFGTMFFLVGDLLLPISFCLLLCLVLSRHSDNEPFPTHHRHAQHWDVQCWQCIAHLLRIIADADLCRCVQASKLIPCRLAPALQQASPVWVAISAEVCCEVFRWYSILSLKNLMVISEEVRARLFYLPRMHEEFRGNRRRQFAKNMSYTLFQLSRLFLMESVFRRRAKLIVLFGYVLHCVGVAMPADSHCEARLCLTWPWRYLRKVWVSILNNQSFLFKNFQGRCNRFFFFFCHQKIFGAMSICKHATLWLGSLEMLQFKILQFQSRFPCGVG